MIIVFVATHTNTCIEGDIQNGEYFSGDVWVDESVGGAVSACTDWLTLTEEEQIDELSSSSPYNLSIINTGASERYDYLT